MPTTTTITAAKDNYLDESNVAGNKGGLTYVFMGANYRHGAYTKFNSVLEFDVSALTKASLIYSAVLTLEYISSPGSSTTQTVTLARLNQGFNETGSSWNEASSGVIWTGGSGAFGNAETSETTYTFSVGSGVSSDVAVDIKDLVVDAIENRSGTLLLVAAISGSPSGAGSGYTKFASAENITKTCSIDIIESDRIAWDGSAGDGDLSNSSNWVGNVAPTAPDHAVFNSGSLNATTGAVTCDKLFVGKGYTGSIENERQFTCNRANIFSPYSDLSINFVAVGQAQVRVGDCKSLALNGNYDLTISRCRSSVDLSTSSVDRIDAHTSRVAFVADANVDLIRITDAKYTLDNGAASITATGRSYGYISATTNTTAAITVSGGYIKMLAKEVDSLTIYSGRLDFRKNIQAPLDMGAVKIYSGVLDSRTDSATFAAQSIVVYGGRLLLDGSQQTTLA